jgi:hypothetical protein
MDMEGFSQPYTKDDDLIVSNHPMIIMAEENRRVRTTIFMVCNRLSII